MIEKWKDRKDLVFSCMCLVGRVEKWRDGKLFCLIEKKSERIENGEKIEKWKDRKDLVFSCMCLVGRVEKWRDGKLFYLVEKKSEDRN